MKKITVELTKKMNKMADEKTKEANLKLQDIKVNGYGEYVIPEKVDLKPFYEDYPESMNFLDIEKAIKENKRQYEEYINYLSNNSEKSMIERYISDVKKEFIEELRVEVKMSKKLRDNLYNSDLYPTATSSTDIGKQLRLIVQNFMQVGAIYRGGNFKFNDKESSGKLAQGLLNLRRKDLHKVKQVKKELKFTSKEITFNEFIKDFTEEQKSVPYKDLVAQHEKYLSDLREGYDLELEELNETFYIELKYRQSMYRRIIAVITKNTNLTEEQADHLILKKELKQQIFNMDKEYPQSSHEFDNIMRDIKNNVFKYVM